MSEDVPTETEDQPTSVTEVETNNNLNDQPRRNRVAGTILWSKIEGDDNERVAVFPSQESGVHFLKENAAWGFVKVGQEFDYVAMYISGDESEVRFIAEVDEVVDPEDADIERSLDNYEIGENDRVIQFKEGSLHELEDPVPFESKYPQSHRYTTLGELKDAETTDDML